MVKKVTVSLPNALLDAIDAEARALGTTRSFLMQEASAHYVAHTAEERAAEERRRRIGQAIAGMRAIGNLPARDPRSMAEILRETRDFDGGGPAWGTPEREAWEREVGFAAWREEHGFA